MIMPSAMVPTPAHSCKDGFSLRNIGASKTVKTMFQLSVIISPRIKRKNILTLEKEWTNASGPLRAVVP
jgi:hypothetical protein